MTIPEVDSALLNEVHRLGPAEQRQVLDFARALRARSAPDASGKGILQSAGAIGADDLAEIVSAIEESCERVDLDEW